MSKSLERIVLAVVLALLVFGVAGLAYTFPKLSDIVGFDNMDPKGHAVKKLNAEEITAALASWNKPAQWPDNPNRLFNSIDILFYPALYPGGDYLKILGGDASKGGPRSPGGVLLSWYQDHHIKITDPAVDRNDPDGDGFSNITEYKNEELGERLKASDLDGSKSTNPNDPQSHPSYLSRLRLKEYENRPFKLTFNSYEKLNGVYEFQIYVNGIDSSLQPQLKKTGEPLGFEGYMVGDFHLNIVTKHNDAIGRDEQVDESWLEILKPDIGFVKKLPFQKLTDAPESTANFVMLMPSETGKVMKVPIGKNLVVPFIPDVEFLVISVDDNGATIRDLKTKKEYHIIKLDPSEWDEVPVAH